MWRVFLQQNQKLGAFQARFNAQSAWALRWAVTASLLVVILPAIVLVLAAILIGLCVFFILSTIARIGALFGMGGNESRPTSVDIGLRENVRVMKEE
jgi:hypothetical protein